MNSPVISIISAVYNVENYIKRCIDSIVNQTFKDFELILVNDGSTDNSGDICNEYALKDSRIKVYHKTNGGVASARGLGISVARGTYSIHIDPDDWIEPTMLEEMYNVVKKKNSDILIVDYYVNSKNQIKYITCKPQYIESKDLLISLLRGNFFGGLCHKLIRHSLYSKYNINFFEGINYCEDFLIWAQLLQNNLNISYLNKAFYHYNVENLNSISRNYNIEKYNQRKKFYLKLKEIIPNNLVNNIDYIALSIKIEAFSNGLMDKKEFYSFAPIKVKYILSNKKLSLKIKIILLIAIFFSFKLAYKLYKII